ncbi:MAG: tetratricopeptide repeat protein [Lysobacterales bacterium]
MTAILALLFSLSLNNHSTPEPPALDCAWLALANPGTRCTLDGGWVLARKGQQSGDPGYYQFAMAIGRQLADQPQLNTEATLLHGYSLQQLHRFDEAYERVAPLLSSAPIASVHQLLGDIRLEQGRFDEAVEHYQQQLDVKPSPSAYARAAKVRYLAGNVKGAIELIELALEGAARSSDSAELAWVLRLGGRFLLSRGDHQAAIAMLHDSVRLAPVPDAYLLLAKSHFAAGNAERCRQLLQELVAVYPSPDAQRWLRELTPSLANAQRAQETAGASIDARGQARSLLTSGGDVRLAKRLLDGELSQRQDPITLSIAGWAQLLDGNAGEAALAISQALVRPYPEPFPYLVGALVAHERKQLNQRDTFLARVAEQISLLSPSERAIYARLKASAI